MSEQKPTSPTKVSTATQDYFVTRRCKTASGQLLERDNVYALTAVEAEPLIENEILRLPKKGELAAAKQA